MRGPLFFLNAPISPVDTHRAFSRRDRLLNTLASHRCHWSTCAHKLGGTRELAARGIVLQHARITGKTLSDAGEAGGTLGVWSLLSIGIGGMIGGGIFAVTGLTVELTHGAAPLAFVVAGVVALLTAYSYWKLTRRYPSSGGTVEFLNRAYGSGAATGALSILLCLSYIVLLAIYAYAFGSYGAELFGGSAFLAHVFATAVLALLAALNFVGPHLVIRSENSFNLVKMSILIAFIAAGLVLPAHFSRLEPVAWVAPVPLIAGAMVIFLNYEGFELIANAGPQVRNPGTSLPIAYLGGVVVVMIIYVLIATVVIGHMSLPDIDAHRDSVLSAAAQVLGGSAGGLCLVVAALVATSSAINATFYGSGRLTYLIAKYGELPVTFEHNIRKQPVEGIVVFAVLSIVIVNLAPLAAIATMGSAGFLLIFAAVNLANLRLAHETHARRMVAAAGLASCVIAFAALCWQTLKDPTTRWQIGVLASLIAVSVIIELIYRRTSRREIHMGHHRTAEDSAATTRPTL